MLVVNGLAKLGTVATVMNVAKLGTSGNTKEFTIIILK
jgi:hypothetical protein